MGGGDGPPEPAAGADFFRGFSFFARFSTCFHENFAYCDHAITPCDSLSALLTVPCCSTDRACIARGLSIKHSVTT